jgi:hypothetical protein
VPCQTLPAPPQREVLQRQEKSIQILPNLIGIDGDLPSGSAES